MNSQSNEKLYFQGFLHLDIDDKNKDVIEVNNLIQEIDNNNIKSGFSMEEKYDNSADLRPNILDYDDSFKNICESVGVIDLLSEYLSYKPSISVSQLRAAYEGSSYLSWHRDTHKYNNEAEVAGNTPPIFKAIYYPHISNSKPRNTLRVSSGSHMRYYNSKILDLTFPKILNSKKVDIQESSSKILIFNTALLHSVLAVKGKPIYRLITSFK